MGVLLLNQPGGMSAVSGLFLRSGTQVQGCLTNSGVCLPWELIGLFLGFGCGLLAGSRIRGMTTSSCLWGCFSGPYFCTRPLDRLGVYLQGTGILQSCSQVLKMGD